MNSNYCIAEQLVAHEQARIAMLLVVLVPLIDFNDYFYEVRRPDVRPNRPRYRADAGYVGSELTLGLSWGVTDRLRFFGGTQIGFWKGSENEDSPLFRDEVTYGVGGGLRWSFLVSERKVWR